MRFAILWQAFHRVWLKNLEQFCVIAISIIYLPHVTNYHKNYNSCLQKMEDHLWTNFYFVIIFFDATLCSNLFVHITPKLLPSKDHRLTVFS